MNGKIEVPGEDFAEGMVVTILAHRSAASSSPKVQVTRLKSFCFTLTRVTKGPFGRAFVLRNWA